MPPSSGALCDDWERHDPEGRTVLGFNFFLLQADAIPAEGSRRTERRLECRTEHLDPITRAITGADNGAITGAHNGAITGAHKGAITGAHLNRDDGGDGEYGRVTKRLIKRFDCNERWSRREIEKKNGTAPESTEL